MGGQLGRIPSILSIQLGRIPSILCILSILGILILSILGRIPSILSIQLGRIPSILSIPDTVSVRWYVWGDNSGGSRVYLVFRTLCL